MYVGGAVTIGSDATLTLAPNTKGHFLPYHDDTEGGLDATRAELGAGASQWTISPLPTAQSLSQRSAANDRVQVDAGRASSQLRL